MYAASTTRDEQSLLASMDLNRAAALDSSTRWRQGPFPTACAVNAMADRRQTRDPPGSRAAAATLRCVTSCQQQVHAARLGPFECERFSQPDAASPSCLAETLHFGAPAAPRQHTLKHNSRASDGPQWRSHCPPNPVLPSSNCAALRAPFARDVFAEFSCADAAAAQGRSARHGCSMLSNPNSPCSGHPSHSATAPYLKATPHAFPGRYALRDSPAIRTERTQLLHSAAPHQAANFAPTSLQELYGQRAAQAQREAHRAAVQPAVLQTFESVLQTEARPQAGSQHRGMLRYEDARHAGRNQQPSTAQRGMLHCAASVTRRAQVSMLPRPQHAQHAMRSRAQWRPRSEPYLFASMLQQVERLHECEVTPSPEPVPRPTLRRKAAPEALYREITRSAKRACVREAVPAREFITGGVAAIHADGGAAVRGCELAPQPQQQQQQQHQAAAGCRRWEVMHDIARGPEAQWHTEFMNDLAGLLGQEAAQEARPAPPELDAESCAAGSGAVCWGSGGRRALPRWPAHPVQDLSMEHSMDMREGCGEN